MKTIKSGLLIGLCIVFIFNSKLKCQDIKLQNGATLKTISYGLQVWTSANLNVDHFRNGDVILEAATPEEWIKAGKSGQPAWCYYENNPDNGKVHGKLYNWYAVNDPRGLAPEGYHIPTNSDWRVLIKNLKGIDVAGTRLKSKTEWKSKKGTNEIGFNAIPSGYRDPEGKFRDMGSAVQWWTNSVPVDVKPSNKIFTVKLSDSTVEVKYYQSEKGAGYSVRCEKD